MADTNFTKLDEKDREDILKFNIDSLAKENLKDSVDKWVYLSIKNVLNISEFNQYLERHKDAYYRSVVMARRNDLAFEAAKTKNTAEAYELFFLTYPNDFQTRVDRAF